MKLFTKKIERELQKQYHLGADLQSQNAVVKIFDPTSQWTWWILNQDPENPDYLWAIVRGFELEIGSVSKRELEMYRGRFGLPLERDLSFKPINALKLWETLTKGGKEGDY